MPPLVQPAEEAALHVEDESGEDVEDEDVPDEALAVDAEEGDEEEAEEEAEPVDPVTALREELRTLPGEWYVIHTYAGYENRVKTNLEQRAVSLNVEDFIFQAEVPQEEVAQIKNGERKTIKQNKLPGLRPGPHGPDERVLALSALPVSPASWATPTTRTR